MADRIAERARWRQEDRNAALARLRAMFGEVDAMTLVRCVLEAKPDPDADADVKAGWKGRVLDAAWVLDDARAAITGMEGRLLDEVDATSALPKGHPGRITWGEVGEAFGVTGAALSKRQGQRRQERTWIDADGTVDPMWAGAIAAAIGQHFELGPSDIWGDVHVDEGASTAVIEIRDRHDVIRSGRLAGLDRIRLSLTLPGPPGAGAPDAAGAELWWRLDAASDTAEMGPDMAFLGEPGWDEDPKRLGRRLAAELHTYQD